MKGKLFLSLFVFSLVFGAAFFSSPIDATNLRFEQRFINVNGKQDEGGSGAYSFDKAHSSIGFRVKHMGLVDVPGYFRDFTGTVNYDAKDVTKSTVEFTAKVTSVDTGVAPRDNHLRSKDYFEVEKFADMTFKSTKVEKKGSGLMITGDLTLKGVTKSISFPLTVVGFLKDQKGGTKMGAVAETVVSRKDFGVGEDKKLPNGAEALSDKITVVLNIEANMPAPTPAK